jgi:hypothetical protein
MNDGRRLFGPGGGASDYPGLAGVGVNHIGAFMADQTSQCIVGGKVVRRQDGAAQGMDFPEDRAAFLGVGQHRTFRSVNGTIREYDLVARRDLGGTAEDGVLLGASEDQSRDDVKDLHGARFPFFSTF